MTETLLLETISREVSATRDDIQALATRFDDFRVSMEHRVTKAETRASVFGALAGAIISALTGLWHAGRS